jgi:hypothetical protein
LHTCKLYEQQEYNEHICKCHICSILVNRNIKESHCCKCRVVYNLTIKIGHCCTHDKLFDMKIKIHCYRCHLFYKTGDIHDDINENYGKNECTICYNNYNKKKYLFHVALLHVFNMYW